MLLVVKHIVPCVHKLVNCVKKTQCLSNNLWYISNSLQDAPNNLRGVLAAYGIGLKT